MSKAALRLFLIRHGETAWSLSGRHTGRTDLPLTPHGEAMARDLAPVLQEQAFMLVLTSPRLRARSTCSWAGLAAQAQVEPDLSEWDYGDYEGLRSADIRTTRPDWDVWRDGCPGGEHPADASARADRLIARLSHLHGNVALFSHGQFGCMLAARWIGMPAGEGRHFVIDPASIGILACDAAHAQRHVISRWNAMPQAAPLQAATGE